jgi:hypothetical protein
MAATNPANTQALTQVLITLLPVIVGGMIAITGGVLGSILSHILKTSSDRRDRRRAKLEEIVTLTFETEQWLERQRDYFWRGKQEVNGLSPLDKCKSMTNLYFPALRDPMSNFWMSAVTINKWILTGGQERSNAGEVSKAHMDSYSQAMNHSIAITWSLSTMQLK